ncbi:Putative dipeptidase ARB_02715 [Eumeta japonica]|uniref:Dipeptidase n=1 Tax=Eumeta variegata TaxID=151549 RepID=A0A4C1URJ1_EUMVA|nr:Putative dipeptidase ARB_02715 [Eumeta japonica]
MISRYRSDECNKRRGAGIKAPTEKNWKYLIIKRFIFALPILIRPFRHLTKFGNINRRKLVSRRKTKARVSPAHINHIRDVAGVDSVGLGAGFDGINYTPQGLEDVSSYPLLFAELMEAGWTMDELRKLAGLNLLRVLGAAERVARELAAAQVAPYEDTPPRPPDPHNCSSQDL